MKTKTKTPRIERDTKLWIPHQNKEIAFKSPSIGPDTYVTTGKAILDKNQRLPTGEESASLVHAAYCIPEVHNEPEFAGLRDIMRTSWIWVFNRNLWTPEGVYVVQDPKAVGTSQHLTQDTLERRLRNSSEVNGVRFSNNGTVRFAPKETYKLRDQTPEEFANDGFVIASFGKEGAEKLAETATKFRNKPFIYGLEVDEPTQRVSALCGYVGAGLDFGGLNFEDNRDGHAFGVLK